MPVCEQGEIERLRAKVMDLEQQNAALRSELGRARRQLSVLHALTVQYDTLDIALTQERLLQLITKELGYERAFITWFDATDQALTGWIGCSSGADNTYPLLSPGERLHMQCDHGPLAQAVLLNRAALISDGQPLSDNPHLNAALAPQLYAVLPLFAYGRTLGALVVDNPTSQRPVSLAELDELVVVTRHAALVICAMQLRIDHAHRLTSEEQRGQAIIGLQEAVAQRLYGLNYMLDAMLELLPERPDEVRDEVMFLQAQVQEARAMIGQAMFKLWPEQLSAELLARELCNYGRAIAPQLECAIEIDSHYDALPLDPRQQLFQLAQDALWLVIRYAAASQVQLVLRWSPSELHLEVSHNGQPIALSRPTDETEVRAHSVLHALRSRVEALAGRIDIHEQAGRSVRLQLTLPVAW